MKRSIPVILLISITTSAVFCDTSALRENGTIPVWLTAGPFSFDARRNGAAFDYDFLMPLGGEERAIPKIGDRFSLSDNESIEWVSAYSRPTGELDFRQLFDVGPEYLGVGYAFCQLQAEKDEEVLLKVSSNDGVKVWVNDAMVHRNRVTRGLDSAVDRIPVTLKKGANRLLFKVDQFGGSWGLRAIVRGLERKPAAQDAILKSSTQRELPPALQALPLAKGTAPYDERPARGITATRPAPGGRDTSNTTVRYQAYPLVARTPEGERQCLMMDIATPGLEDVSVRVEGPDWPAAVENRLGRIPIGQHRLELQIPRLKLDRTLTLTVLTGDKVVGKTEYFCPRIREWTVYMVQHTHTDVGFTKAQEQILPEHLRFIDRALDHCDSTDGYPNDAQFRWTCEITWTVQEYLQRRSAEQIERLKRRIQEDRIEITGLFLNLSEIATESSLAASLQPLRRLQEELGIQPLSAMQNDVNGAPWCLPDLLQGTGVRYLTMGINNTRSRLPFNRPTPFWWESPSGNRILAYRADHYHTGNFWKLHLGDSGLFSEGLLAYLSDLKGKEYPYNAVGVQFSGYQTDNSPPTPRACDLVKEWNQRYTWPRLRLALNREFPAHIEKNYGDELPVIRRAWPDWWTDGFGSAARETAVSRQTHTKLQLATGLLSMASFLGEHIPTETLQSLKAIQKNLLFYDEHTFGYAGSVADPLAAQSMMQWGQKSSYVWEAAKECSLLLDEGLDRVSDRIQRTDAPQIAIVNTLNWERTGLCEAFIDYETVPSGQPFRLVDIETGQQVVHQILQEEYNGRLCGVWAEKVPAFGYRLCRIEQKLPFPSHPAKTRHNSDANILENAFYRVTFDPATGGILHFVDRELDIDLVDTDSSWQLGQFILERTQRRENEDPKEFEYATLQNVSIRREKDRPLWASAIIEGNLPGAPRIQAELRLYHRTKKAVLLYTLRKDRYRNPEGIYVAFPLALPEGELLYESQGGIARPQWDHIPGSAADWNTVQSFAAVRNPEAQIVWGSDALPLVQFGDLNFGKWQDILRTPKTDIYSWVMNNYWFTNFRGIQEGEFSWTYFLTSSRDTSNSSATQFGWESRVPLLGHVLSPETGTSPKPSPSLSALQFRAPNILLVEARPAHYDAGVVLHLRETEGEEARVPMEPLLSAAEDVARTDIVTVLERVVEENVREVSFAPYEAVFLKVSLE